MNIYYCLRWFGCDKCQHHWKNVLPGYLAPSPSKCVFLPPSCFPMCKILVSLHPPTEHSLSN